MLPFELHVLVNEDGELGMRSKIIAHLDMSVGSVHLVFDALVDATRRGASHCRKVDLSKTFERDEQSHDDRSSTLTGKDSCLNTGND